MSLDNPKVGIITFEKFHGRKDIGSSRIRGEWLVKYWDEAEIFKQGKEYDVVIYQKAYWVEHARAFKGIKILDVCDPDFLHFGYKFMEMINEVDAITVSSPALQAVIKNFTNKPVRYIPDRVDLDFHRGKKFHQGEAEWAIWFGYSTGFDMLKPVLHFLKKFNLNLIVISESDFSMPSNYSDYIKLKNIRWNLETVNQDILLGDVVLNPQSNKGKWKFKSNNKTLSAWALGMPVAHTVDELEKFLVEENRKKESDLKYNEVREKWDVKISVEEFKNLIKEVYGSKK